MVVSEYEPVHLLEVMLPDGTLLTDHDPSEGGWHGGTMRQRIGKELFSIGINNANYGINSTAGVGEGEHPYFAAQLTAHNTRGVYSNGFEAGKSTTDFAKLFSFFQLDFFRKFC